MTNRLLLEAEPFRHAVPSGRSAIGNRRYDRQMIAVLEQAGAMRRPHVRRGHDDRDRTSYSLLHYRASDVVYDRGTLR